MSQEKQAPTPVQLVAELKQAVEIEKRQSKTKSAALRDVLTRVIAEYNKMVTNKKHKIDSSRKNLVLNLSLNSSLVDFFSFDGLIFLQTTIIDYYDIFLNYEIL